MCQLGTVNSVPSGATPDGHSRETCKVLPEPVARVHPMPGDTAPLPDMH